MHNIFVIAKREYLERVRTKAFIIMTLLMPAMLLAYGIVPSLMMNAKTTGVRNVVIASAHANAAEQVKAAMAEPEDASTDPTVQRRPGTPKLDYNVQVSNDVSDANLHALESQLSSGKVYAIVWLDQQALDTHNVKIITRSSTDFNGLERLRGALREGVIRAQLGAHGLDPSDVDQVVKPFELNTIEWKNGHESKSNQMVQFFTMLILGLGMYMVVLLYGINVMRAVIEEKTSRIMEVLLSTCTSKELMAGKILGVGAVGLTQVGIWVAMVAAASAPGLFAWSAMLKESPLSASVAVYFVVFFILGFLLYSSMCAALGAMVNSEQEAQQLQLPVMMPYIFSLMLMFRAIAAPTDPFVVAFSFVPFCAPLLMFARIVVQTPPLWQILLSIALLILGIWAVVWVAARIYRVGALMYGKRPTLPEIIKWVKYAG